MERTKISRDKELLLKTLARFDSNSAAGDATDLCEVRSASRSHTFFMQVILEALCGVVEPEDEKRLHLFNGLYTHLVQSNFLNQKIVLDDLLPARRQLATKFTELVRQVHSKIVPSPTLSLTSSESTVYSQYQKYSQTFEELEVIAKGGFGTVCKARHKVDEVIYAVKKIIFKYKSDADYLQVIREVKSIATLNHMNIVSYNNAWIEYLQSKMSANASSSSSSSTHSSSTSYANGIKLKTDFSPENMIWTPSDNDSSLSNWSSSRCIELSEDSVIWGPNGEPMKEISNGKFAIQNFSSHSAKRSKGSSGCTSKTLCITDQADIRFRNSRTKSIIQTFKESNDSLLSRSSWTINMNVKVMLCIQMEFCDCDLRLWLNERGKENELPFNLEVTEIFKHILNGVAHIHSKSIIHRDLKPQNIFFSTKDNVMKIGDFGLATLDQCSADNFDILSDCYSSNLGTVPYAAPEQRSRNNYDTKVDIYSLGIILIELLSHFQTQMEFSKTISDIVSGNLPFSLAANWPQYIHIVRNLVQKDPKVRMSAKEILSQPPFLDDHEIEKCKLMEEIRELKGTLAEKNSIIKQLKEKLKQQDFIILKQKQDLDVYKT